MTHQGETEFLEQVTGRIRAIAPDTQKILLFGSRARGDARDDSDFDLLLVVPEATDTDRRAAEVRLALWNLDAGFDIVVLTPGLFDALRASRGWYARSMLAEARVLHEAA